MPPSKPSRLGTSTESAQEDDVQRRASSIGDLEGAAGTTAELGTQPAHAEAADAESRRASPGDGLGQVPRSAVSTMGRRAEERELLDWVTALNVEKGITPTRAEVWRRWRRRHAVETTASGSRREKRRGQQWVRRWRKRWKVIIGKAMPGPGLDVETLRAKANVHCRGPFLTSTFPQIRHPSFQKRWPWRPIWRTKMGVEFRPPNRDSHSKLSDAAPVSGSASGPKIGPREIVKKCIPTQAMATFRYDAFLASRAGVQDKIVRINMDESSIKMWPGPFPGCLAKEASRTTTLPPEQRVSVRAMRGALSLVAFVSDDESVAQLLPQIVVVNQRHFSTACIRNVQENRSDNIYVMRRETAWITSKVLCNIIRLLAKSLQPVAQGKFVILSMDACPTHTTEKVLRTMASLGIHFHPLPASMTKWVQPCDVAVFSVLKAKLREAYSAARTETGEAELSRDRFLELVADVVGEVLQGRYWGSAFQQAGLCAGAPTSKRFATALGWSSWPTPEVGPPTLAELQCIFPRNRHIPIDHLFRSLQFPRPLGGSQQNAMSRASDRQRRAEGPSTWGSWTGRLRSSSRTTLSATAATVAPVSGSAPGTQRRTPIAYRLGPCRPPPFPWRRR